MDASDLNWLNNMIEFEDVYHTCYSVEIFRNAYYKVVHPLLEADLELKEDVILLPNLKRPVGRLRNNLRREK